VWSAVLIAVLAVALGAALTLVSASSPRVLGPLRTFATFAALAVVIAHLLPESFDALGVRAMAAFVVALIAPGMLHRLGERVDAAGRRSHAPGGTRLGLEVSYAGLVAHHVGDGAGIGAYATMPGGPAAQLDVIIALVAHTMPLVAVIALAYEAAFGMRAAALRIVGLALASVVGVVLTAVVPVEGIEAVHAWVAAIASGLLLHVVTHDLTSDPPTTLGERSVELLAVAAGVGVAALGARAEGFAEPFPPPFQERAYELLLKAALPLCAGLAMTLLVQKASKRVRLPAPNPPSAFSTAVLGAARAVIRPTPGDAAGGNVAYYLAAPALGLEMLALSVALFGAEFGALRFAGALLLPIVISLVLAVFPGRHGAGDAEPKPGGDGAGFAHASVALSAGVLAGALLDAYVAPAALLRWSGSPFELVVVSSLAVLFRVPALVLIVPVWVLVQKGLSPGAALIALLVGPLFGLRGIGELRAGLGAVKTAMAALWMVSLSWALAFGESRHGALAPLFESRQAVPAAVETASLVALAVLALLVLQRMHAMGARSWLAALSTRS
jgi:hypothetical protein